MRLGLLATFLTVVVSATKITIIETDDDAPTVIKRLDTLNLAKPTGKKASRIFKATDKQANTNVDVASEQLPAKFIAKQAASETKILPALLTKDVKVRPQIRPKVQPGQEEKTIENKDKGEAVPQVRPVDLKAVLLDLKKDDKANIVEEKAASKKPCSLKPLAGRTQRPHIGKETAAPKHVEADQGEAVVEQKEQINKKIKPVFLVEPEDQAVTGKFISGVVAPPSKAPATEKKVEAEKGEAVVEQNKPEPIVQIQPAIQQPVKPIVKVGIPKRFTRPQGNVTPRFFTAKGVPLEADEEPETATAKEVQAVTGKFISGVVAPPSKAPAAEKQVEADQGEAVVEQKKPEPLVQIKKAVQPPIFARATAQPIVKVQPKIFNLAGGDIQTGEQAATSKFISGVVAPPSKAPATEPAQPQIRTHPAKIFGKVSAADQEEKVVVPVVMSEKDLFDVKNFPRIEEAYKKLQEKKKQAVEVVPEAKQE